MKKSTLKLVIRGETVRALVELDLVRVAGGSQVPQLMDTGGGPANTCVQVVGAVPPKP